MEKKFPENYKVPNKKKLGLCEQNRVGWMTVNTSFFLLWSKQISWDFLVLIILDENTKISQS
jgi:hypothetical protein